MISDSSMMGVSDRKEKNISKHIPCQQKDSEINHSLRLKLHSKSIIDNSLRTICRTILALFLNFPSEMFLVLPNICWKYSSWNFTRLFHNTCGIWCLHSVYYFAPLNPHERLIQILSEATLNHEILTVVLSVACV